jgi:hypothetical protein
MSERNYLNRAGEWLAVVKAPGNGWIGESKKGTPFIRVPLLVDHEGERFEIVWRGWLTDSAFDYTVKTLAKAFGWDGNLADLTDGLVKWEGRKCQITTAIEEYDGQARCLVQWLNPAGGGASKVEQSTLDELIKTYQRRGMAIAREEAKAASSPAKAKALVSAEAAEDDDIPF